MHRQPSTTVTIGSSGFGDGCPRGTSMTSSKVGDVCGGENHSRLGSKLVEAPGVMIDACESSSTLLPHKNGNPPPPSRSILSRDGQKGEAHKGQRISPTPMADSLPDLDNFLLPEIHGNESRSSSTDWGHGPPTLSERDLAFLCHTPPVGTPSSYGAHMTKHNRRVGPQQNTFERHLAHTWGGRKGEESAGEGELSTSLSEMRLGLGISPPAHKQRPKGHERRSPTSDGTTAARRLRSCAQLKAAGIIDERQQCAIKDLLILGEDDELHAALDEYVSGHDASRLRKLIACGGLEDLISPRQSDSVASVGHEFDSLMDIDGGQRTCLSWSSSTSRIHARAHGLSDVSLDSDELESVANAALVAAAAAGSISESPDIAGVPLSHSLSSREGRLHNAGNASSTGNATTLSKQSDAVGNSRSQRRSESQDRRSGAGWDTCDEGAFEMDLDDVLDGACADAYGDEFLCGNEMPSVAHTRFIVRISNEALAVHNGGDSENEDDDIDDVTAKEGNKPKKKGATAKSKKEKAVASGSSGSGRRKATSANAASRARPTKPIPARRKKKDDEAADESQKSTNRRKTKGDRAAHAKAREDASQASTKIRHDAAAGKAREDGAAVASKSSASEKATVADRDDDDEEETAAEKHDASVTARDDKKTEKGASDKDRVMPATVEGEVSSTVTDLPPLDDLPDGNAPGYDVLINYPRAKARGARHCVMCGRTSAPTPDTKLADGDTPTDVTAPDGNAKSVDGRIHEQSNHSGPSSPKPSATSGPPLGTPVATSDTVGNPATPELPGARGFANIPKQNKDVCRQCDKATWKHASTRCYFKWCKGCKRFQNLVAFRGKLQASKCDNCRARGREGYMRRKDATGENTEAAEGAAEESGATRRATGDASSPLLNNIEKNGTTTNIVVVEGAPPLKGRQTCPNNMPGSTSASAAVAHEMRRSTTEPATPAPMHAQPSMAFAPSNDVKMACAL